ncbi:MAG: hypothetical protein ACF8OB_01345 [Phycisphaeraceae bacterium JB051]
MNIGGWIIMSLSVGGMSTLLGWCIYKVLSTPGSSEHLHTQNDIDPHDDDDDD